MTLRTNSFRPRRFCAIACAAGFLAAEASSECTSVAFPGTPVPGAQFGASIAWDGDLAIVGAPQDKNGGGTVVGAVYLYHRVGSSWTLEGRFEGDGLNGVLGKSVAISANGLAAAGRPSSNPFSNPGQLRTYVRNSGAGTWSASTVLTQSSYLEFPASASMSGNDLVAGVGLFLLSGDGDFGHFRYNGSAFVTLVVDAGGSSGVIESIAISGLTLALGYPAPQLFPDTSSVKVRTRSSTSSSDWNSFPIATLQPADMQTDGRFAAALAYAGTPSQIVVVGAPNYDGGAMDEGAAYVFKKTGSTWAQEQKLVSPLASASSNFGAAVATNGTTVLVGQPGAAGGAGRVFVFDAFPSPPLWRYSNALLGDGLTSSTPQFGAAVVLQGSRGLVGAPQEASAMGAARSIDDVHCTMAGYCFGDGSGTPCPCGNNSAVGSGTGCLHSFGTGSLLAATGTAHVVGDTVQLQLSGSPPTGHSPTFFQGTVATNGGMGTVFGDGLRCATGSVLRLGTRPSSGGNAAFGFGIPGDPPVSVQGAIPAAGVTRFYQVNHRNAASFCTSATFNLTNGLRISWSP